MFGGGVSGGNGGLSGPFFGECFQGKRTTGFRLGEREGGEEKGWFNRRNHHPLKCFRHMIHPEAL